MIVYNVKRRWFALKSDADAYRVAEGLKPAATVRIEVADRDDLAALLNALCEPQASAAGAEAVVPAAVVDRAFVAPTEDPASFVPLFLRREAARRNGEPEPLR